MCDVDTPAIRAATDFFNCHLTSCPPHQLRSKFAVLGKCVLYEAIFSIELGGSFRYKTTAYEIDIFRKSRMIGLY